MTRCLVLLCACLALSGCSAWKTYKCVRDIVDRNEPYLTQMERDDSEALARQTCRERSGSDGG